VPSAQSRKANAVGISGHLHAMTVMSSINPAHAVERSHTKVTEVTKAESGIYVSLLSGTFTAILAGKNGGTGIGLVDTYNVH
jgi:hypothetical protein